jgi:hypothetical protein
MVSKWYENENKKTGDLTPSKIFIRQPKDDIDLMR